MSTPKVSYGDTVRVQDGDDLCTAPTGKVFAGWFVSDTDKTINSDGVFVWQYTENKILTAHYADTENMQCEDPNATYNTTTGTCDCNNGYESVNTQCYVQIVYYCDEGNGSQVTDTAAPGSTYTPVPSKCEQYGQEVSWWSLHYKDQNGTGHDETLDPKESFTVPSDPVTDFTLTAH